MKISEATRKAILSKDQNHVYGKDGFCINCKKTHRTDWKQNELCSSKSQAEATVTPNGLVFNL